jgi:two-component system, chemotaxis family, response regulator Rcp1
MDVLLVDDNEGDARLLREVLSEINRTVRLHVVTDGLEAMAFLKYQGAYLDAPRPQLILLDLHMPKLGGLEVLAQAKADPHLRTIPIVILTSSQSESDIVQSYQLMANCYLTKPTDFVEFERLIKNLNEFWLIKVRLQRATECDGPAAYSLGCASTVRRLGSTAYTVCPANRMSATLHSNWLKNDNEIGDLNS